MQEEISHWIINWFKQHHSNQNLTVDVEVDFYQSQLVDSFGIIELIEEVENHFAIRFNDDDFKSHGFRTVQGLAQLIAQRIQMVSN